MKRGTCFRRMNETCSRCYINTHLFRFFVSKNWRVTWSKLITLKLMKDLSGHLCKCSPGFVTEFILSCSSLVRHWVCYVWRRPQCQEWWVTQGEEQRPPERLQAELQITDFFGSICRYDRRRCCYYGEQLRDGTDARTVPNVPIQNICRRGRLIRGEKWDKSTPGSQFFCARLCLRMMYCRWVIL